MEVLGRLRIAATVAAAQLGEQSPWRSVTVTLAEQLEADLAEAGP